jgi:hypothetical protein
MAVRFGQQERGKVNYYHIAALVVHGLFAQHTNIAGLICIGSGKQGHP